MAKDKSLGSNPALSFHKQTKKDAINKAKNERLKSRDAQLLKRRPDQFQRQIDELRQLSKSGTLNAQDRKILESLERDLARVNKLRAQGKQGPVVVSERTQANEQKQERQRVRLPKYPERSIYYDAVFNPTGMPPPGMPYRERADLESGSDSDSSVTSSVARIPMPDGTPPPLSDNESETYAEEGTIQSDYDVHETKQKADKRHRRAPGRMGKAETDRETEAIQQETVSKTTYSSEPVLRDLKREAAQFVPKSLKKTVVQPIQPKQIDPLDPEILENETGQQDRFDTRQETQNKRQRLNLAPDVP